MTLDYPKPQNSDSPHIASAVRAPPSGSGKRLAAVIAIYLSLLAISSFSAGVQGETSIVDEVFIALIAPFGLIGFGDLLKKLNFIAIALVSYLILYLISSVAMLMATNPIMPFNAAALGLFLEIKPILFFGFIYFICSRSLRNGYAPRYYISTIFIFSFLCIPFYIHDIFSSGKSIFGIPLKNSGVFGYIPIGLFTHKVSTAITCSMGLASSVAMYCSTRKKIFFISFIILSIFLIYSDSVKELIIIPFGFFMMIRSFLSSRRNINDIAALSILSFIVIPIAISIFFIAISSNVSKRSELYVGEETVRSLMYSGGVAIAGDKFPLGSGGGTFGSQPTRTIKYSPLYYEQGLQYKFGSSPEYPLFIMDTWWPKVMAESGYLGFLFYFSSVFIPMIYMIHHSFKFGSEASIFGMLSGVTIFSMSFASSVFTGSMGLLFAALFWFSYLVCKSERDRVHEGR